MNLESLEQENKEYLKRLSKKKILPIIGLCFALGYILYDIFKADFSVFHALGLIFLTISGIILLQFSNLEKKDKLIDDFFYENHLIILEKMREINCRNSFEFSKEHLAEIIRNISYIIKTFRHTDDREYIERLLLDKIYYEITYKIVKNESETNIFQIPFFPSGIHLKNPIWREKIDTKENLPLDLINNLYRIKKSKKKKPEKAFKIIKITGKTDYSP